jgi:hypothetical protein
LGNLSGFGTCLYANGNIYEGNWLDHLPNGSGKEIFANGSSFKGNGKRLKHEGHYTDGYKAG